MKRSRTVVAAAVGALIVVVLWLWWPSGTSPIAGPGGSSSTDAGTAVVAEPSRRALLRHETPDGSATTLATAASGAEVIATFGWGSGDDALGRERQAEGNPEGPMSFAVAPDGTVVILDQVNQRLVKLDRSGRRAGSVPLPVQAAQEVVVTKDGTALVMDRLVDKAVAVIGPDGKPRGELPLEGKGLAEGGASTGLFHDGDDVLVEREHGDLVRVGKTDGKADAERGEVPGRPSRDGASYLTAMIIDAQRGLVAVTAIAKATLEHRFTRQVPIGQPMSAIVMLDSDATGVTLLGVTVEAPDSTLELPRHLVVVQCLDGRDGAPLGRVSFPANAVADESFRELSVGGDGSVLFLRRTDQGAQLERYRCQ